MTTSCCFVKPLHSATLVLLYMNTVVNICYFKSAWYNYYEAENEHNLKMYKISIIFTSFETIILIATIVSVIKKKVGLLDWSIIMLSCNSCLTIFRTTVYLTGHEFQAKIQDTFVKRMAQTSAESIKIDIQNEIMIATIIESIYCFAWIVLKIYSAMTMHRYRNELESPMFVTINTLLQRNTPPPKPPGYGLWYPPMSSELHLNDLEAPPPYSVAVDERY